MFKGSFVAIVTPFTTDGQVDYDALTELIEFQIANGTSGIVPCGTTGESPTLSHEEHDGVIQHTIRAANKRVPVIAGTGSNCTDEAIRLSRHAQEVGADAVLLVNPYYNKPTQGGLVSHFLAIADAISIPICLYNIPGRSAVALSLDTIKKVGEHPNVQAIKEATCDMDMASQIRRETDLALLSGDDPVTLPLIALGATGVISVTANIAPRQMADLVRHALDGHYDDARRIHYQMHPVFKALFVETNPIGIKTALGIIGKCSADLRLPMSAMSAANEENLKNALLGANLL